jgi:hypothetical protein
MRQRQRKRKSDGSVAEASVLSDLPIWPETVQGGKFVRLLERELENLRCEDTHGNRELFLDDVFVAYLLAFYNPTLRTLRTLEDFSQTRQAQKHLSIRRMCKSTLSDFNRLAEPQRLEPIIAALRSQLSRKQAGGRGSHELLSLLKQVIAVDGTFLPAAAGVAWAVCCHNQRKGQQHRARLDWHVDVQTWLPELVVVPDPGESEADSALRHITPGAIHLYDRGYISFDLMQAHAQQQTDFVLRLRCAGGNSPQLVAEEERPLSEAARAAGVISDRVGRFASSSHPIQQARLREVVIRQEADGQVHEIRLVTTLLDVDAEVVAQLYRHRWQIELFFRWLKCYGHFNHLISHAREGVLLQFYVTIIGVLVMYLHTGHRPSKYLFALLSQVAGGATLGEILPILRERERQCRLARESAAKRRAKKLP